MAWLSGWSYRKEITITGQTGAGTNYQVLLDIGATTGGDFHLEGHCTNFPQDIEVTDNDETTLLDFWIEDITADPLKMWVEVADDLGTNKTIYVYYGKSGATTNSSGANTFRQYHGSATANYHDTNVITGSFKYQSKFRTTTAGSHNHLIGIADKVDPHVTGDGFVFQTHYNDDLVRARSYNEGATTAVGEAPPLTQNTWYIIDLVYDGTDLYGYVDDNVIGTKVSTNIADEACGLFMNELGYACEQTFSFVRKYNATEPAFSSAGSEETESTQTTTLLHGKIRIKDTTTNLTDGKVQIKDIVINLADGQVRVLDSATGLTDGLLSVQDKATGLTDGKVQVQDSIIDLADGKVIVTTAGLDTGYADGKIQIKDVTTNIVDGLIKVKDSVTGLVDGKVKVSNIGSNLADGLIRIKDAATGITDGFVRIKDTATGIADGKIRIKDAITGIVDGKVQIKDAVAGVADGRVKVQESITDRVDGKIHIKYTISNAVDGILKIKDTVTNFVDGHLNVIKSSINSVDGKLIIHDLDKALNKFNALLQIPARYRITTSSEPQHNIVTSSEPQHIITPSSEQQHTITYSSEHQHEITTSSEPQHSIVIIKDEE